MIPKKVEKLDKTLPANPGQDPKKYSGTIYTLVYRPHEGFANYAVATLEIDNGVIKKMDLSDPYAGFEALAKLELCNDRMLEKLRKNYPSEFKYV